MHKKFFMVNLFVAQMSEISQEDRYNFISYKKELNNANKLQFIEKKRESYTPSTFKNFYG